MTLADGERAALTAEEIREHLGGCAECRQEVAELEALSAVFTRQRRRASTEDVWPAISERLAEAAPAPQASPGQPRILPLALLLGAYKLVEFVPDTAWPLAVQFIPLAVALVWFLRARENPLRVEGELTMEGGQ
jgi:anti-sigma factor RsiW